MEPSDWAWMDKGSRCLDCDEGARQGGARTGTRMTERTRKGSFVEPFKEDQVLLFDLPQKRIVEGMNIEQIAHGRMRG